MGQLIDIFTRKVISDLTEASIFEAIEARFGDSKPEAWDKWLAIRDGHSEPYAFGDPHAVAYRVKTSEPFNAPMPLPCVVSGSVAVVGKGVYTGLGDPFAWMDTKYHTGYNWLAKRVGLDATVYTRSDLIAHDDYLDLLKRCKSTVYIVLGHEDQDALRALEPGAPSNARRLQAAAKLREAGINVIVEEWSQVYSCLNEKQIKVVKKILKSLKKKVG